MKKIPINLAVFIAVFITPDFVSVLRAATVTLIPVADTAIRSSAQNNNFGRASWLPAGVAISGSPKNNCLFKFNLSSIPTNATVTSATFSVVSIGGAPGAASYDLNRLLKDWGEGDNTALANTGGTAASAGEATWNARFHSTANWGVAGGQSGTDYISAPSAVTSISVGGANGFNSAGMVSDVQRWLTNSGTNFGWILMATGQASSSGKQIQSSSVAGSEPTLTVVYTVPVIAPTITTTSPLPAGTNGLSYSQTFAATGGTAPYTWSLLSGTLPGGLTLSSGGLLNGTPTNSGTFNFTIKVTDNVGSTNSKAFALTINPAALVISTASPLPSGMVGASYLQTFAATGGTPPYSWSLVSSTLPSGLTLGTNGTVSGTPTVSGTFPLTVRVTDSVAVNTSKSISLTINPQPQISSASVVSNQFNFTFAASAGQSYTVESRNAFGTNVWNTFSNISAPSVTTNITVKDSLSSTTRFYRVRAP